MRSTISFQTKVAFYQRLIIKKLLKQINKVISSHLKLTDDLIFDISIINDKQIQKINHQYRQKNQPTDVISFAFKDAKQSIANNLLGEIFISWDTTQKQAKQYQMTWKQELARLIVHGILHLLQYDHINNKQAKLMFQLQEAILQKIDY